MNFATFLRKPFLLHTAHLWVTASGKNRFDNFFWNLHESAYDVIQPIVNNTDIQHANGYFLNHWRLSYLFSNNCAGFNNDVILT